MSFFNTLSLIGTKEITNKSIKSKVILSNQFSFVSSFVIVPYVILNIFVYPPLAIFYGLQILATLSVIYFNAQRNHNTARLMSVLVPNVFVSLSALFIAAQTSQIIPTGLTMVLLALSLTSFLFIELKEWLYWLCIVPLFTVVLVFPDSVMGFFSGKSPDLDFYGRQFIDIAFRFTAMLTCTIILYLFITNNEKSTKENQDLVDVMELKNQEQLFEKQKAIEYIQQIEANQILEKQREWASAGMAKLSQLLREAGQDSVDLYDKIISNLTHYLNANQAAIFVVEEQDGQEVLVLRGAYAYNRKKYLSATIQKGQGMVGQCMLEKEPIFLAQVPKNYMVITSGLGQALPTSVLIQPLIANEKVYGVIEIASFELLLPYKLSFIAQVAEIIASAILSEQTNVKTKKLLETSLQQREEMRNQEEEMRQQMEELQATQEEMQRKEKEIELITLQNKNLLETLQSDYDMLKLKSKRKDKKIAELEAKQLSTLGQNK